MKGLAAGADEFLTKPVDRHELNLRMTNLLVLRSHTKALTRRNAELAHGGRLAVDETSALPTRFTLTLPVR